MFDVGDIVLSIALYIKRRQFRTDDVNNVHSFDTIVAASVVSPELWSLRQDDFLWNSRWVGDLVNGTTSEQPRLTHLSVAEKFYVDKLFVCFSD